MDSRARCALATGGRRPAQAGEDPTKIGTITVAMEDCKASRPGRISKGTTVFSLLFSGGPKDQNLAKKGSVAVDGRTYWLYLPKASSYTLKNTGERDDQLENTSTLISLPAGPSCWTSGASPDTTASRSSLWSRGCSGNTEVTDWQSCS
jgi:hypothetical protein